MNSESIKLHLFSILALVVFQTYDVESHLVKREVLTGCGEQSISPYLEQPKKAKLHHSRRPRVVGGVETNAHSWPWQVIMYICDKNEDKCQMICGGTLIGPQTVVTAGHCVFFGKVPPTQIKIRLGAHKINEIANGEKNITVASYGTGKFVIQDVAVLHLKEPVTFTDSIKPACLPSTDLPADTVCYVVGWGEYKNNDESPSPVLRQAPQEIQDFKICKRSVPFFDEETEICAKWKRGVDSCYGDSGGPLLCLVDNKWELHGIISFGRKAACGRAPGYYTKVLHYKSWILDHM